MAKIKTDPLERFRLSYTIDGETECWIWAKYKDRDLYGRFKDNGIVHRAHRYIYQVINGPVGPNMHIHHKCFNTSCVNPSHLEAVSASDNQRENFKNNRCSQQKLSPDNVIEIKKLKMEGQTVKELADKYRVSISAIYAALNGEAWSWI